MVNPYDFGASGDGVVDDTEALQHALQEGDGTLHLSKGTYRLTKPLVVDLTKQGYGCILGDGGTTRLVMEGPGPALRILGDHNGTATPRTVKKTTWEKERFPTISGLEILGGHKQAVGIELLKTMQCTITNSLIRNVRYGVHLRERNRNFLLSHSHIYDNHEFGVFFDHCNLHQTVISANHISYNKRAGIKSLQGDIHNLHITGNDIEYNNLPGSDRPAADIWFEATDEKGRISEVSIASNTIQATVTENGANVRIHGERKEDPNKSPLITIVGNVIGSQTRGIELKNLRKVSVTGNTIYDSIDVSLHVSHCSGVCVGSNTIGWRANPGAPQKDGLFFSDCDNVIVHGLVSERLCSGSNQEGGGISLTKCTDSSVTSCHLLDPMFRGIELRECVRCRVSDNTILDRRKPTGMLNAVRVVDGSQNLVQNNMLGQAKTTRLDMPADAGRQQGNMEVDS